MKHLPCALALLLSTFGFAFGQTEQPKQQDAPTFKTISDGRAALDKARATMKATREALDRAEYAKDNDCAGRDEGSMECRRAHARIDAAKAEHGKSIAAFDHAQAELGRVEGVPNKAEARTTLPSAALADTMAGEVIAVTDGDTITVQVSTKSHKIRLNGIDAPESDQEFGREATRKLAEMIIGKSVVVIWNKTDRHERILGTVAIGSIDVGLELLRYGLAWYFHRYEADVPEVERALYLAAETAAREQKVGLWNQPSPIAPWDWRDRKEPPLPVKPSTSSTPTPTIRSIGPRSNAGGSRRASSVQCGATTKRGYQCKRMTRSSNGYCWQHGGN